MSMFKGLRFAGLELRSIFASKPLMVALVAVALIPLLYGALYLLAFMDPYEKLDNVQVAVVNLDEGAEIDGEMRNIGDTAVEKLQDGGADEIAGSNNGAKGGAAANATGLGWNFVTLDEAKTGLESGAYYMMCVIPEDFTECVASASGDNPRKAELEITYNESKNMLASQVGGSVWKEMRSSLSDIISEEYWTTTFTKLNESADSIQEAGEGASTLTDGIKSAVEGSAKITTNLGKLHNGAKKLENGLDTLSTGASDLSDGISGLNDGLDTLKSGSSQLSGGADNLAAGASNLSDGVQALASKVGGLGSQLQTAVEGANGVASGASSLKDGAGQVADGAAGVQQLAAGEEQLLEALRGSTDPATQQVLQQYDAMVSQYGTASDAAKKVADGAAGVKAGASSLSEGATSLSQGLSQAAGAIGSQETQQQINALVAGAKSVADGAAQVASGAGSLASGAAAASAGAGQINDGAKKLADGAASAADGSSEITSGSKKLADGSGTLTEGLGKAADGSSELADALLEGAEKSRMDESEIDGKSEVMSAPVTMKQEYFTTVKNYGTGFAPYFIGLGLWVGALFAVFVLRPFNYRSVLSGGNSISVAFSGYIPMAVVSIIQALILLSALQFGLQLQIDNVPGFYAFGIFLALVFAALMQFLGAAFGLPGRFLAVILLMLQLTSAAGTFPVEMSPAFFNVINPFMPMTYSVDALRVIMTGLDYASVATDVTVLLGLALVCFTLTVLVVRKKRIVAPTDMHPLISIA